VRENVQPFGKFGEKKISQGGHQVEVLMVHFAAYFPVVADVMPSVAGGRKYLFSYPSLVVADVMPSVAGDRKYLFSYPSLVVADVMPSVVGGRKYLFFVPESRCRGRKAKCGRRQKVPFFVPDLFYVYSMAQQKCRSYAPGFEGD
jgi:hypothetical protein